MKNSDRKYSLLTSSEANSLPHSGSAANIVDEENQIHHVNGQLTNCYKEITPVHGKDLSESKINTIGIFDLENFNGESNENLCQTTLRRSARCDHARALTPLTFEKPLSDVKYKILERVCGNECGDIFSPRDSSKQNFVHVVSFSHPIESAESSTSIISRENDIVLLSKK